MTAVSEPAATPVRPRGRPPRTDDQKAERRTRLVDAAMDAVRRFGPEVSIDVMAEAAEVSKPVLYSEFGDKTGLVDAMAVVLAARVEQEVVERVLTAGTLDPRSIIGAIVESVIELIDHEPNIYAYIVRSFRMRDRGLLDNALVRVIHDRAALILGPMANELSTAELDILVDGVFAFVFGVIESWVANRQPPKDQLVAMMTAAITAGVAEVVAL